MNVKELVKEELVVFSEATGKTEVLSESADLLAQMGMVKSSYKQAVIDREKKFPTGLETENDGIALPHTDSKYVNKPGIVISILKNKIPFIQMGTADERVQVEVIFMLAIKKAEEQLELLQTFVELIQNEKIMDQLKNAKTGKEVITIIDEFIDESI